MTRGHRYRKDFRVEAPHSLPSTERQKTNTEETRESAAELTAFNATLDDAFRKVEETLTSNEVLDPTLRELLALPMKRTIRQAAHGRFPSAKDLVIHLAPSLLSLIRRSDQKLAQMSDLNASYVNAASEIVQQQIEEGEKRLMLGILRAYDEALEELELHVLELEEVTRHLREKQAALPPVHQRMTEAQDLLFNAYRASVNFVPEIESILEQSSRLYSEQDQWRKRLPDFRRLLADMEQQTKGVELAKSNRRIIISEIERLIQKMDTEVRVEIDAVVSRIQHFTYVFDAAKIPITEFIPRSPTQLDERIRKARSTNLYATPNPPSLKDFSKGIARFSEAMHALDAALRAMETCAPTLPAPRISRVPGRPNLAPRHAVSNATRPPAAPVALPAPAPSVAPASPSLPTKTEPTIEPPEDVITVSDRPLPARFIVVREPSIRNATEFYKRLVLTVLDATVVNPNLRNKRFASLWWGVIQPLFRPSLNLTSATRALRQLQEDDPPLVEIRYHGHFPYPVPTELGRQRARQWQLLSGTDIRLLAQFNDEVSAYRRATYRSKKQQ